ncbi:ABC transporter ATP-binding protein [Escherichia coli]|uniref:ABC transporter ATP-binding protein n=1 Tax=Escherichia coli TaxID=562 RepID=A0A2X1LBN0_ECOLX|nr:ABC transporter ATP-binding protein [Escherichia coli]
MSQILLQPANAMITLENVNKWYGQFHVLKNINFNRATGRTDRSVWPFRFR